MNGCWKMVGMVIKGGGRMNYMKQIAQMLGVELEEEFNVHCDKQVCKFTEHGLLSYSKENQNWMRTYGLLEKLLTGWTEIIKKPILDEVEKEYLSNVIEPFRGKVKYIVKRNENKSEYYEDIRVVFEGSYRTLFFPYFEKGTMYKGMELDKEYTLEDLGL